MKASDDTDKEERVGNGIKGEPTDKSEKRTVKDHASIDDMNGDIKDIKEMDKGEVKVKFANRDESQKEKDKDTSLNDDGNAGNDIDNAAHNMDDDVDPGDGEYDVEDELTPETVTMLQIKQTESGEWFPDGGFGWAVVIGAFIIHIFIGPIASALCHRFNCRIVVFWGALLCFVGIILSAFAPNIQFLYFSYCVVGGFGHCLTYTPSLIIITSYFNKRRGLAVGVATAGVGLGMFLFPPLLDNVSQYLPEVLSLFTFQCISNATVAVDTFFVLRLTPPYMLFLMFYVPLFKSWSNGPLWPQQGVEVDECKDSWWWNLLYINNFTDMNKMCMAWSWYLANDMQFYVLSPILLVPLYYSPLWGSVTCLVFILVNFISTGVISSKNHLSTSLLFGGAVEDAFNDVYVKPWCRIGPYAVGFFTGYVLYKNDCKIRMSKWLNTLGWVLATAVSIMVLYGLYTSDGQAKDLGNDANALYNATSRTAWGMCIAWVVFACATGYGGPVNTLLSWHGVIPLSRLTYCAYLVHPVVIYVAYSSLRTPLHLYDMHVVYYFLGHVCLSYAVALVVSLAFESPMMGLEKALLGRGKNS